MFITIDWFNGISLVANFLGLAFICYQWRDIQLSSNKDRQIQNLIRTLGEAALSKSVGYEHQLELITAQKDSSIAEIRFLHKARDEMRELHVMSSSLQAAVNPDVSAFTTSLEQLNKQKELRAKTKSDN